MNLVDRIAAEVPYLRRYARALTGDPAAADDLVQDVVERALVSLGGYRERGKLRAWLFTIVANLQRDDARRAARRSKMLEEHALHTGDTAPDGGAALAFSDVALGVDALPADQRQVLLLIALEGMSYRETAEILNIPVGTVMSRLARARERLRRHIDGADPVPEAGAGKNTATGDSAAPALRRIK